MSDAQFLETCSCGKFKFPNGGEHREGQSVHKWGGCSIFNSSPPLAPVLEWEGTGFLGEVFVAGDWLLRPLRKYSPTRDSDVIAEWSITRRGYELTRRDTLENAQLLASSIQRLLDET